MSRPTILAALSVCLMTVPLLGAKAPAERPTGDDLVSKRPIYRNAQELREACQPYLKPPDPRQAKVKQRDEFLLFIVPYLGSEDQELRDAAVDILAQLMRIRRHIRASAFKEYLSRDNPINVRLVALAHSLYGFVGEGERSSYPERRAEMEAAWTETVNDIAESPVTPPNFDVLAFALRFHPRDRVALIKPENQPVMVRRLLALASGGTRDDRQRVMELLRYVPLDTAASAVVEWYRVEPDADARAACVSQICWLSGSLSFSHGEASSIAKLKSLKPILELAAQDTDPEIAKRAKESLEKAEAFLEKERGLSEQEDK